MELDAFIQRYNEHRLYHNITELCHMMRKSNCDKGLDLHNYSTFYFELFKDMRYKSIRFLEIGYKKYGTSMSVWRNYFSRTVEVFGADIESGDTQGIFVFDQKSPHDIRRLFQQIGHVDIIIDDGIHDYESNMLLFTNAIPFLNSGGLYIIEDVAHVDSFQKNRIDMMLRYKLDVFHILDIPHPENQYDNRLLIIRKKMIPRRLTILTAASQNHAHSLIQLLCSIIINNVHFHDIYIYDLGLEQSTLRILHEMFPLNNIHMRTFNYSQHPDYFNIHVNSGHYAWKPVIIQEMALELQTGILFWCDAGNKIMDTLDGLMDHMAENAIYTPISLLTVGDLTHPGTLEYMSAQPTEYNFINRNAAQVCFNLDIPYIMDFITEWADCARVKKCIAPLGSDLTNHRYDQSILTLLFYRFIQKHPQDIKDDFFVLIHQDID